MTTVEFVEALVELKTTLDRHCTSNDPDFVPSHVDIEFALHEWINEVSRNLCGHSPSWCQNCRRYFVGEFHCAHTPACKED